ncbi:hypothetical protein D3C80_2182630 [compost metagenome]
MYQLPILQGVERLASIGDYQPGRTHIGSEVFTSDWNRILQADRVVEIDDGIDARQAAVAQSPFAQCRG